MINMLNSQTQSPVLNVWLCVSVEEKKEEPKKEESESEDEDMGFGLFD